jgi:colanic acid biosynthesis glycosyl transferase WcaI
MRVLIVSQYFWPENFRINDLATYLVSKGHHVTVLTGFPNYPDGRVFDEYRREPKAYNILDGVEVVRVPLIPRGLGSMRLIINYLSFALMASILGPWKLRSQAFDLVFVNQLSPVTVGIPGALLARIKKVPMVMWVLDLWPDTLQALDALRSPMILFWVELLVSSIYRRCDLVLSQSQNFIPIIRKLAPLGLAVEYCPSWAEDFFQTQYVEPAPEVPECYGSFDVMFAGNIGEAQDFPCILAAAEVLKGQSNIRWLIVGDGRMKPWVEKEIQCRGLSSQVKLLGRFSVERMPSFYQTAHVLLVTLQDKPIFNMTIPGKLQSYLASGKPVVGALGGEGAKIIRESGAGYLAAAGDYIGLADAVLKLSRLSDKERLTMGIIGKIIYEREFKRATVLSKLENRLMAMVAG